MIRKITSILVILVMVGMTNCDIHPPDECVTGSYWDVFIQGNYAYCAAFIAGLDIIDISNPPNPVKVGNCDTSGNAHGVYVSGNYAYVAGGVSGLQVIDITNPASPTLAGSCDTSGNAEGPETVLKYEDLSSEGPGGWNFVYQEEKNLIPIEKESVKMKRIPGPGEPGFKYAEQDNLDPWNGELSSGRKK